MLALHRCDNAVAGNAEQTVEEGRRYEKAFHDCFPHFSSASLWISMSMSRRNDGPIGM